VPGARLIEYDGSAHGLFAIEKERLIADVCEFLEGNVERASERRSAIPLSQEV